MDYRYILFDLDGTLTQSGPGIMNSVRYALKKMGFPELPEETLRKFVGPPLADSMMRYSRMTREQAAQAIVCYREYYTAKGMFENTLYPGVEKMLRDLKEGGRVLALSTSKPELFAGQILEHFHISAYFTAVCGASMDEKRVEKAEIIACTLEALGIGGREKQDVLMVGDREHDVFGARQNRLDCLGVLYGYGSRAELAEAGARYIAQTAQDAARMILSADGAPAAGCKTPADPV